MKVTFLNNIYFIRNKILKMEENMHKYIILYLRLRCKTNLFLYFIYYNILEYLTNK
jgi:hypothetical protein